MGNHERPRPGRHRKPSSTAKMAAKTVTAAAGIAATGTILLGSPAMASVTHVTSTAKGSASAYYDHLHHVHHMDHLRHMAGRGSAAVTVDYHVSAGIYSFSGLEALWRQAGGSAAAETTAACIAEHESGGNPNAESPTWDFGLWQVHGSWGPEMATFSPLPNAEAAVKISSDGTNWGAWTTAPYCGV